LSAKLTQKQREFETMSVEIELEKLK